jgi:hypothetical protein
MYPELLGKPVLIRFKTQKPLEGHLLHFDSKKLIIFTFDGFLEIILNFDSLEPNLYSGRDGIDYKKIMKKYIGEGQLTAPSSGESQ